MIQPTTALQHPHVKRLHEIGKNQDQPIKKFQLLEEDTIAQTWQKMINSELNMSRSTVPHVNPQGVDLTRNTPAD